MSALKQIQQCPLVFSSREREREERERERRQRERERERESEIDIILEGTYPARATATLVLGWCNRLHTQGRGRCTIGNVSQVLVTQKREKKEKRKS